MVFYQIDLPNISLYSAYNTSLCIIHGICTELKELDRIIRSIYLVQKGQVDKDCCYIHFVVNYIYVYICDLYANRNLN